MEDTAPSPGLTPAQKKLVMEHTQWACRVVARLARRYGRTFTPAEVRQIALASLTGTARRYNPSLGVPFAGFALKPVRGAVKKAANAELRFHEALFTAAEHWAPDGSPLDETDESARDELYARAGDAAAAMLFALVGAATDVLSKGGEDRAIESATLGRVLQALSSLRPRQREVIERRLLRGQEIEEAAREMGVGASTVQRDFRKGIERLKKLLGAGDEGGKDEGEEPGE